MYRREKRKRSRKLQQPITFNPPPISLPSPELTFIGGTCCASRFALMALNRRQPQLPAVAKHGLLSSRVSSQGITRSGLLSVLALLVLLLLVFLQLPGRRPVSALLYSFSLGEVDEVDEGPVSRWKDYTVARAAAFAARNDTLIVTSVSEPFLPMLNNWLISIARQKRQDQVLIFAEDYATLYEINRRWPGHAVLVQPAPDSQTAHDYGSQGFYNITSRRPRHLLDILELGYSVMYNDVDIVWVADPFRYLEGDHDVYFTDDMFAEKPLNHSHNLPPPETDGQTNICSCMIFLRPTRGGKKLIRNWIEEIRKQHWSENAKPHDQPAFNCALRKTAKEMDLHLLPQAAFPSGGLYFRNADWVKRTEGMHAIVHNNYMIGFQNKIKRFKDYGLWLADDHADESPLGQI